MLARLDGGCSRDHGRGARRGYRRFHRTRIDQILFQLAHIIFQRLDSGFCTFAENTVGSAAQKAHFDQPLLKPLRSVAIFADLQLRIKRRGHADHRNGKAILRPEGQVAVRIGHSVFACRGDRLVNGLCQRFGIAAIGRGRAGHDAAKPILHGAPILDRITGHIKGKLAAIGHAVYRYLAGDVVGIHIYALVVGISISDLGRARHVLGIHQLLQVCLPRLRCVRLCRRDKYHGSEQQHSQNGGEHNANFLHSDTSAQFSQVLTVCTFIDAIIAYFVSTA